MQVRKSAGPKVRFRRAKALIEVKLRFNRRASADDVQRVQRRCLGKGVEIQAKDLGLRRVGSGASQRVGGGDWVCC